MARTGHESIAVLQKYDRLVQHASELGLPAWFGDMDREIPELYRHSRARALPPIPSPELGPGVGQPWAMAVAFSKEMGRDLSPRWTPKPGETGQIPAEIPPSVTPETPLPPTSGPAENKGVGQAGPGHPGVSTPEDSPVELALAAGLTAAIAAEQWEVAKALVAELGERRRARVAPGVPSLDDRRKERKP